MEQPPAASQNTPSKGQFSQAVGSCLRFLVRAFLIFLLALALGLGVYFGAPALFRAYVQPFETSMQRLSTAQSLQEQTNQQLQDRLQALQARLDALELQNDNFKQEMDQAAQTMTGLDAARQAGEQALAKRDARILELSQSLDDVRSSLSGLEAQLSTLEALQAGTNSAVDGLAAQLQVQDLPLVSLRNELQIVKSMEYLTRCRLFLSENNLGLAAAELSAARALLLDLQQQAPAHQKSAIDVILRRLQMAAGNLPASPILATEDLEIAWQLLQVGLPILETPAPLAGATPAPTPIP